MKRHGRHVLGGGEAGFTLVELLVVIAVIGVLVALLLPTLSRARDQAVRLSCLSNMRQLAQGTHLYAAEWGGFYPPSNLSNGDWCYAFDLKKTNAPSRGALGLGLLITTGVIPLDLGKQIFHDPTMDTTTSGFWGHSMDMVHPWGAGVSWFESTNDRRIVYAYNYRAPSFYRTRNSTHMKQGNVTPNMVLLIDMPDRRFGRQYNHVLGYNVVRMDGSGGWFDDRTGKLDAMHPSHFDGRANPAQDEDAFRFIEVESGF